LLKSRVSGRLLKDGGRVADVGLQVDGRALAGAADEQGPGVREDNRVVVP